MIENLASEDDEDTALVLQIEDAINEVVQNDSELSALYSSYQDARKRLSEQVRFRGSWKVKSSEKGKSKGFKGSKGRASEERALEERVSIAERSQFTSFVICRIHHSYIVC